VDCWLLPRAQLGEWQQEGVMEALGPRWGGCIMNHSMSDNPWVLRKSN
jgi:hypothetical protein